MGGAHVEAVLQRNDALAHLGDGGLRLLDSCRRIAVCVHCLMVAVARGRDVTRHGLKLRFDGANLRLLLGGGDAKCLRGIDSANRAQSDSRADKCSAIENSRHGASPNATFEIHIGFSAQAMVPPPSALTNRNEANATDSSQMQEDARFRVHLASTSSPLPYGRTILPRTAEMRTVAPVWGASIIWPSPM